MNDHKHAALKKISLFADLPDDMIAQIAQDVKELELTGGDVLFTEGEEGDALYFIQTGEVEIYQADQGKTLALLDSGDYFGEMALLEEKPRSASARAHTDASLLSLERGVFLTLLENNPKLGLKITSTISNRLRTSMAGEPAAAPSAQIETATKVFISYSRRDKDFVQKLHKAIRARGVDAWVDWDNIPLTADWWKEIQTGIENADAFAFVISPDSLSSEVCLQELQTAIDNQKRLVPILHRDPQPGDPMPSKISSHNWIFMHDDAELEANVSQMLEIINTDLDYVKAHTRLLERALEWERSKKNPSFLLQGDNVQTAENWLEGAAKKQPQPTPLHIAFIQASRRAANQRQRMILTASLVGLAVAVVLAIVSFVFFLQARSAQGEAELQRDNALAAEAFANQQASLAATAQANAEISRDNALVAQATALAAEAEAQTQAAIALTEQARAEAQKAIAEEQAQLAQARGLAASGQALLNFNPALAALLALESQRLSPNNQTALDVLSLLPAYAPPLKLTLFDPAQLVIELAWSPEGRLASISENNSILLWNLETRQPDQILYPPAGVVTELAWSRDGRLATGSDDGTIVLWDLASGTPEVTLPALQSGISSLAWSPAGRLASSSWDGTIIVWDLANQTPDPLLEYGPAINSVAWSPFGQLASGSDDGRVAVWDVQNAVVDVTYSDHQSGVLSVAWSPEGHLASGSRDSTVAVRNPFGNFQDILRGHTDYVNVVRWSDDGQLASASWDQTIILWDLEEGAPQQILRGHTRSVDALGWGPAGQLASGADFLYLWDTNARPALQSYAGHLDWTYSVVWSPEGQLVSTGSDGYIIVWDQENHAMADRFFSTGGRTDVSFNQRVLSGNLLIDRNSGNDYVLHDGDVLVFSPDGNFIAGLSVTDFDQLGIWAVQPLLETGQVISTTHTLEPAEEAYIALVAWSPDGEMIATGQSDGTIALWDFDRAALSAVPRAPIQAHEGALTALAWSPDGRLASAGADLAIHVWYPDTLEKAATLTGVHQGPVLQLSWNPSGQLTSLSGDERVVIWDVEAGIPQTILRAPFQGSITSLAWSPDGSQLAIGGQSYNVYVYNASYLQTACAWLTRNMTFTEWKTYLPNEPYRATCPDLPVGRAFLDNGLQAAVDGDIETAVQQFEEAENGGQNISHWEWGSLCWWGALYNQAERVYFACERAVELDPENAQIRDSRGVARALLGDFEGAIEDFEAFVATGADFGFTEEDLLLRESWIEDLQAGVNPFDEDMLAFLRDE